MAETRARQPKQSPRKESPRQPSINRLRNLDNTEERVTEEDRHEVEVQLEVNINLVRTERGTTTRSTRAINTNLAAEPEVEVLHAVEAEEVVNLHHPTTRSPKANHTHVVTAQLGSLVAGDEDDGAFEIHQATRGHVIQDVSPPRPKVFQQGDWAVGGRLIHFTSKWASIHTGSWVFQIIRDGHRIDFTERPEFGPIRETPLPRETNLKSILMEEVDKLVSKNAIIPIYPPFGPGFWSTFFLATKKNGEWRPIINLKPLNIYIKPEKFKMENLPTILKAPIKGSWAASIDLKDAYLHVPIHPSDRKWLRFMINKQAYTFKCLPFGLSTAPRVFTRVVQEAGAFLRRLGIKIFMYLDDWLIIDDTEEATSRAVETVLKEITQLGFIVNLEKSCLIPSQYPIFLGARLDLVSGRVFPTQERIQNLISHARSFLWKKTAPASEWLRILGFLASMVDLVPFCRFHMRMTQMYFVRNYDPLTQPQSLILFIIPEVRAEIKWWTHNTNLEIGTLFPHPSHQMTLTTDASMRGWGGFTQHTAAHGTWSSAEAFHHINMLELWAVRNSLGDLETSVTGKRVLVRSDNTTVVAYINKQGGTKSEPLCRETLSLLQWCQKRGIFLSAIHIPGIDNVLADNLSRGVSSNVSDWSLASHVFHDLLSLRNFPTVDLFATNLNKQLRTYCSRFQDHQAWAVDALSISWKDLRAYAFPPIPLIDKILQKIQEEDCEILLVAPFWPKRQWFQTLLRISVQNPIHLPRSQDILRMPGSPKARFHATDSLNLTAWSLSSNAFRRKDYLKSLPIWQPEEEETQHLESTLLVPDLSSDGVPYKRSIRLQQM